MKAHLGAILAGLALGGVLAAAGFGDYGEVHKMFVFADLRLFLTFCGAVMLSALGFAVLARKANLPRRAIRRSTIVGAIIFGIGWAITGACPAASLVQLGGGQLPALATLGGILVGVELCSLTRSRWLHWEVDSCDF